MEECIRVPVVRPHQDSAKPVGVPHEDGKKARKASVINGILAISFGNTIPNNFNTAGAPSAEMYFTAGPNGGSGGLFGYVTAVSTDLIKGSDQ